MISVFQGNDTGRDLSSMGDGGEDRVSTLQRRAGPAELRQVEAQDRSRAVKWDAPTPHPTPCTGHPTLTQVSHGLLLGH
jgi:hypothetical protein